MRRRQFLRLALPAIAGLLPMAASAQFVEQPVRIIYPFAAGGSGDAIARMIADKMRITLGRSVVVENRTGARDALASPQSGTRRPTGARC